MFSRYDARIRPPGKNSSHQLRAAFCNRDKPTFHWARCEQAKKKEEVGLSNNFASEDGPLKRRERDIFFPFPEPKQLTNESIQSSPNFFYIYVHHYEHYDDDHHEHDGSGGGVVVWSFLLVPDEATVVSVNMFVRDFIEINDLKMVIMKQILEVNAIQKRCEYECVKIPHL